MKADYILFNSEAKRYAMYYDKLTEGDPYIWAIGGCGQGCRGAWDTTIYIR